MWLWYYRYQFEQNQIILCKMAADLDFPSQGLQIILSMTFFEKIALQVRILKPLPFLNFEARRFTLWTLGPLLYLYRILFQSDLKIGSKTDIQEGGTCAPSPPRSDWQGINMPNLSGLRNFQPYICILQLCIEILYPFAKTMNTLKFDK